MRFRTTLSILILLFSLQGYGQSAAVDITGLWKGTLYNDTTGQTLKYEIAISEYKGKLSGYSHTYFIIDDKEYHGVKKVRVKRQNGKIIVEDQELIANNYPIAPAKNVRQLDVLDLLIQDSIMVMSGPFSTNRTRDYHSLTGSISVQRKNDYRQSALVPHLEELGLVKNLSFVPPVVVVTKPNPPEITEIVKAKPNKIENETVAARPDKKVKAKDTASPTPPTTPATTPVAQRSKPIVPVVPTVILPAADVNKRKIETVQSVYYKSDSLVLTLYDNGEVDGDTVSVLVNGSVIIPKQGLSTRAFRKTIYVKDMPDSIQVIMYAENLGSIAPNTGLLVVKDGEDIYEIRFTGDMEKNSAIVFRRKPNDGNKRSN